MKREGDDVADDTENQLLGRGEVEDGPERVSIGVALPSACPLSSDTHGFGLLSAPLWWMNLIAIAGIARPVLGWRTIIKLMSS